MGIGRIPLVSAVLTIEALLFQIIGFATPNWTYNGSVVHGLWTFCASFDRSDPLKRVCLSIEVFPDWFKATQAFEILGCLALVGVVVLIVLKWCFLKDKKTLVLVAFIGQFAAAGLILIGVIIFAAKTSEAPVWIIYGYSFVLCVTAALLSVIAGVFNVADYRGCN